MSWGAMLAPLVGAAAGTFMGDINRQKQVQQQRELNEVNEESAKNMGKFNYEQQMKMLKETGPEFQVGQLKGAGMSVGNMYGGSGAGGAIQAAQSSMSPASAEGVAAGAGAASQMGMLASQMALMGAQKENIEADTANKKADAVVKGVDTNIKGEDLKTKTFDNEVRGDVGKESYTEAQRSDNLLKESAGNKAYQEYKAWQAAGFNEGKIEFTDKNSPVAKAIAAGFEKTVQEVKNAKAENDLTKAKAAVERFNAAMAERGISPNSPWYVKFGADIAKKAGWDILK